jgi:DNA-binding NtrC family response regulator
MPKLTGIAVAREVARRRVNTGVVLITGDDAADAASSAGVVAVLGKPFTADALEAAISQALDARAAR